MDQNNIDTKPKDTKKKKKVYTEEELAKTQFFKELAMMRQQNKRDRCTCPAGFKGSGAFCPVHKD